MPNYNATASLNNKAFNAAIAQMQNSVTTFVQTTQQSMQQLNQTMSRGFGQMDQNAKRMQTTMDQQLGVQRRMATQLARQRLAMSRAVRSMQGYIKALNLNTNATKRASAATKSFAGSMDWMPKRSAEAERALLKMGSAAQGVMLGMGILQGSAQSIGFSLIFLRWGLIKVALAFTALTVGIGVGMGVLKGWISLVKAATSAGKDFEAELQQISSYFQSTEIAMAIEKQAEQFSRTYGIARKDARGAFVELQKIGLAQMEYAKAFGNIAKATGQDVADVSSEFVQAFRSGQEAVQEFSNKYDLGLQNVTDTASVATAANERFKNSLEDWAQTAAGMQARLGSAWQSFLIQAGRVFNEIFKTVFEPLIALVDGMIEGFRGAEEASKANGELSRALNDVRSAAKNLAPMLAWIGNLLGRLIFRSAILAAKGLKIFYDALRSGIRWIKEHKDQFISFGQAFKQNFTTVFTGASFPITFFSSFVGAFVRGLAAAFVGANLDEPARGLLSSLGRAIKAIPRSFLDGVFAGLKAGIILGLIEAFTLTVVDMLPISEGLKASLNGIIRFAFLGAGLGTAFGPWGIAIGAALGAAFGVGLEIFGGEGTAKKWADTLDKVVLEGVKKIPETVATAWGVLEDFVNWLTGDGTDGLETFGDGLIDDNTAFNDWSEDTENKHKPRIVKAWEAILGAGEAITDWVKQDAIPWFQDMGNHLAGPATRTWNAMKDLWNGPVWESMDKVRDIGVQLKDLFMEIWEFMDVHWDPKWKNTNELMSVATALAIGTAVTALGALELIIRNIEDFVNRFFIPALETIEDTLIFINALLDGDVKRAWDAFKQLLLDFMNLILAPLLFMFDTIKNFTDLTGITTAFTTFANFIWNTVIPPFKELGGWIDKAADAGNFLLPGNPFGGGGDNNPPPSGGGSNAPPIGVITPEMPPFQHGGVVPGRRGTRRLVIAEAGERFLGSGTFSRGWRGNSGGGGVTIHVHVSDSVVTNELALRELAQQIMSISFKQMRIGRAMAGIRVG